MLRVRGCTLRATLTGVAIAALAAGAAGCATASVPTPSPADEFAELVDSYLQDPAADDFADDQVATLQQARAAGELTFEDYSAAVDATLECIADAGYYVEKGVDDSRGFPMVNYGYESPEAGNPVAETCIAAHSTAIEAIYQLQPSSVEAVDHHLEAVAREFAECLRAQGIEADFEGLKGEDLRKAIHHYDSEQALAAAAADDPDYGCSSNATY